MICLQGAYGCILVLCDMCVGYSHYDNIVWIYYMCVVIGHACMQSLHILGASYSMDYLRTPLLLHLVFRGLPSEYIDYEGMIWFGYVCGSLCVLG